MQSNQNGIGARNSNGAIVMNGGIVSAAAVTTNPSPSRTTHRQILNNSQAFPGNSTRGVINERLHPRLPSGHVSRVKVEEVEEVPWMGSQPEEDSTMSYESDNASQNSEYHVKWRTHPDALRNALWKYMTQNQLTDMQLMIGEHSFPCHRMVLAAASTYFRSAIQAKPDGYITIILPPDNLPYIHALLRFMYSGEIAIPQDLFKGLRKIAVDLGIRGLAQIDDTHLDLQSQAAPAEGIPFPHSTARTQVAGATAVNGGNIRNSAGVPQTQGQRSKRKYTRRPKEQAQGSERFLEPEVNPAVLSAFKKIKGEPYN